MNTNDDKCHHCNILADVVSRQSKADDDVAESKINENKYLKICATTKKLYENLVQLCSCDEPAEPDVQIELTPWLPRSVGDDIEWELGRLPIYERDMLWSIRSSVYLEYNAVDDIGRVPVWVDMPSMDVPERVINICWSNRIGRFHYVPGIGSA